MRSVGATCDCKTTLLCSGVTFAMTRNVCACVLRACECVSGVCVCVLVRACVGKRACVCLHGSMNVFVHRCGVHMCLWGQCEGDGEGLNGVRACVRVRARAAWGDAKKKSSHFKAYSWIVPLSQQSKCPPPFSHCEHSLEALS